MAIEDLAIRRRMMETERIRTLRAQRKVRSICVRSGTWFFGIRYQSLWVPMWTGHRFAFGFNGLCVLGRIRFQRFNARIERVQVLLHELSLLIQLSDHGCSVGYRIECRPMAAGRSAQPHTRP